jgi:hypothetical protein
MCTLAFMLASTAGAGEIPIVVDRFLPDDRDLAPVRFGVPFPIDTLKPDQVQFVRVVDDRDATVPHQALVTASWDPTGRRGVRWLLIDLQVQRERQYRLLFNETDAPAAPQRLSDIAVLDGDHIRIDAGAIKGALSTRGFDPFGQLTALGWPLAVKPAQGQEPGTRDFSAFYIDHETRGIFRSDLDPQATVVLEETGPMRAVIKADGWYTNLAGEKFCRFSIRLHILRHRPDLRMDHTWIFTGRSTDDRLRSISVQINRTDQVHRDGVRSYVGSDDLLDGRMAHQGSGRMRYVQDCSERGRYDFVAYDAEDRLTKIAHRGGGWLATGGAAPMTIALRDAWQQFPWGAEVERGAVRFHFWPPGERLLDTSWDGQWQMLTDTQKHWLAASKPRPRDMSVDDYVARIKQRTNATGVAKTHELYMTFYGGQYNAYRAHMPRDFGSLAREVAYPVIACVDPAWMAASRAMDWMPQAPRDREMFRDEENYFDGILDLVNSATQNNDWHGFWNWGGYHQHLNPDMTFPRGSTWAQDAGSGSWHRAHPKSHYLWGGFPWLQYFRSGDRRWLRYAQTYTLYSADRAHRHWSDGGVAGHEYHYDNSEIHWLGGYQRAPGGAEIASNLQAKDDYVYMYWLTGDRRALDVLRNSADLISATPAHGRYTPGFAGGNDIRNAGMLLHRMCMAYQATWEPRYLEKAQSIAAAFYPLTDPEKVAQAELQGDWHFHSALGWAYEGLWFYWNITHDEQIKAPLLAFIDRGRDYGAGISGCYSTAKALAYGYMLTGDLRYLDLARAILDDIISGGADVWQFLPSGKMNFSGLPRVMGAMLAAPPQWQRANLPTHQRGRVLSFYGTVNVDGNIHHTRVLMREAADDAWSFDLVSMYGGRFTLKRPDGVVVAERSLDDALTRCVRFDVPADGQSGNYLLQWVEPIRPDRKQNPDFPAVNRIVGCRWPVTIEGPPQGPIAACRGRAYYFATVGNAQAVVLNIGPMDRRRPFTIRSQSTDWTYHNLEHIPGIGGTWRVPLPPASHDVKYLIEFPAPAYWLQANQGRPQQIRLESLPNLVAANADDLFLPQASP